MAVNDSVWWISFRYDGGGSSEYVPYRTTIGLITGNGRDYAIAMATVRLYNQSQNIRDLEVIGVTEAPRDECPKCGSAERDYLMPTCDANGGADAHPWHTADGSHSYGEMITREDNDPLTPEPNK